jgi:hypothetical protein
MTQTATAALLGLCLLGACARPATPLIGAGAGTSGGETTSGLGSSGGNGGSTSSGGLTCGPNAVWLGNVCALLDCTGARLLSPCVLTKGSLGSCALGSCQPIDPLSDPVNCGAFGVICGAGSHCGVGQCVLPAIETGDPCPDGMEPGGYGSCVWQSCTDAVRDQGCELNITGWADVGICCADTCIAAYGDPTNCGACGRSCAEGDLCASSQRWNPPLGICVPRPACDSATDNSPCALGGAQAGMCCGGRCLDVASDSRNCGSCGAICPDGQDCQQTRCVFPSGVEGEDCTRCPVGTACDSSANHCATVDCLGQTDGLTCRSPGAISLMQCCAEKCTAIGYDSNNCGVCGLQCPSDTACFRGLCLSAFSCVNGATSEVCRRDDGSGEGICCEGGCIDPSTDTRNCGGCGVTCPAGTLCNDDCARPTTCAPGSDLAPCATAGGPGFCCSGACVASYEPSCDVDRGPCPPDSNGDLCTFGPNGPDFGGRMGVCCSGSCVDIVQDPSNCGGCGIQCESGICAGFGLCLPTHADTDCAGGCPPETVCARGSCVDSFCQNPFYSPSDLWPTNWYCPQQAMPYCGLADGPYFCAAANGNVGLCAPFSPACLDDLASDPANCGDFGSNCPAGQVCVHGVCSGAPSECGLGSIGRFCNRDAGTTFACCPNAGCTDIFSDGANCGTCGLTCPSGQSCNGGICG